MRGYIKVAATAVAMITIVLSAVSAANKVVQEQVNIAGEMLEDLHLQDFRSCMELRMPQDKDEDPKIEEICEELSGLK